MAPGLLSLDKMKEIVRTYLEIVDAGRYDELLPLLSKRVLYHTIGPPVVGASNLIQYYKRTRVPGHGSHEVTDIIAEANKAAVLLKMRAEMKDGSKMEFDAMDLFTFEGDKIAAIRTFHDLPPATSSQAFSSSRPSRSSSS